jgi:hypothetical protein
MSENETFYKTSRGNFSSLRPSGHREDYCGNVDTDSMETPALIKIFEPHHLGVSCGFSNNPLLPGWFMSLIPPQPIESRRPLPASRQRWWQALWT